MPAQLLLMNPGRPRRRLRRSAFGRPVVLSGLRSASRRNPKRKAKKVVRKRKAKTMAKSRRRRLSAKQRAAGFGGKRGMKRRVKRVKRKARRNPSSRISRRRRARKNPSAQALAIRRAKAAGAGVGTHGGVIGKATPKKRKARKGGSKRKAKRTASSKVTRRKRRKMSKATRKLSSRRKRVNSKISKLQKALKASRKRRKGSSKKSRPSARRRISLARLSALRLQKRAMRRGKGGMSGKARKLMAAHGLTRVNPSQAEIINGLKVLLPQVGAASVGAVALWAAGSKVAGWIDTKRVTEPKFLEFIGPEVKPYVPAIATGGASVIAYAALRMFGGAKFAGFAGPVLMGGAVAAIIQALMVKKVAKDGVADGQTAAQALGMKGIGEYVMGEYVSSVGGYLPSSSMGEYVLSGADNSGVFSGGSILGSAREAMRGTSGEPHVSDFVSEVEGGVLGGGIF